MGQRLGQHFLSDNTVLDAIRDQILYVRDESRKTKTIEIGPGQGALTRQLLGKFEELLAMEADLGLESYINRLSKDSNSQGTRFNVVWGDVLQSEPEKCIKDKGGISEWMVVGNLPYYITSPIFRKFFVENAFEEGVFLIQKEVGQKIATDAKKKSYLWRILRYYCFVEYNFTVPPESFTPPPKVDSAVITIRRHHERYSFTKERLESFLDIVSPLSRKTLGKIQKMRKERLEALGIFIEKKIASKRMEAMSREELVVLLTPSQ